MSTVNTWDNNHGQITTDLGLEKREVIQSDDTDVVNLPVYLWFKDFRWRDVEENKGWLHCWPWLWTIQSRFRSSSANHLKSSIVWRWSRITIEGVILKHFCRKSLEKGYKRKQRITGATKVLNKDAFLIHHLQSFTPDSVSPLSRRWMYGMSPIIFCCLHF